MTKDSNNFPILHLLRGYGCLLILMGHAGNYDWFPYNRASGSAGLLIYFTLSGFLMSYHYLPGELSKRYWGAFGVRRIMRTYPLMLVIIAINSIIYYTTKIHTFSNFQLENVANALLFIPDHNILWSLILEIRCYIVFAIIAALLLYKRCFMPCMLVFLALLLMLRLPLDKLTLLAYLPYFFAGVVVGALKKTYNLDVLLSQRSWNLLAAIYVSSQLVVELANLRLISLNGSYDIIHDPSIRPLWEALTILSLVQARGVSHFLLRSRILSYLGMTSYSLYLVHPTVYKLMHHYIHLPPVPTFILHMLIIFPLAHILYRYIEHPYNQMGKQYSRNMLDTGTTPEIITQKDKAPPEKN